MPRHRVLIVGVGSIGERHLRCFGRTDRCDLAFCEPNETLRQTVAERYPFARAFDSVEDALQREHDAAVICAPAHVHIPIATTLAQAGVHLLIEKPLSTSLEGVDQLGRLIADRKLRAAMAYVYRAMPLARAVKDAIDGGAVGKPLQIVTVAGQHFPAFRPAYREIYYARRETGGGAIQDAITHVLNLGEWFVGPIQRLAAQAGHQQLPGVDVEDTVGLLTRQGGCLGAYSLNQFQHANTNQIQIHGDGGSIEMILHESRWRLTQGVNSSWSDHPLPPLERDDPFILQAGAFLDYLEGLAPPLCTLEEGVQTLKVNLAALRASDEGRWITVNDAG